MITDGFSRLPVFPPRAKAPRLPNCGYREYYSLQVGENKTPVKPPSKHEKLRFFNSAFCMSYSAFLHSPTLS